MIPRREAILAAGAACLTPAIAQVAVFNAPGSGGASRIVSGLTTANVVVEYLSDVGGVVASPGANFLNIRYVRVRIANLQHTLRIPLKNVTFTLPGYPTTLPRESLGIPRVGAGPLPC